MLDGTGRNIIWDRLMQEKWWGIVRPFRKLIVLLNIYLVGITTLWAFQFATEALNADSGHFLHIAAIITAIFAPLVLLTRSVFKMYWGSTKIEEHNDGL